MNYSQLLYILFILGFASLSIVALNLYYKARKCRIVVSCGNKAVKLETRISDHNITTGTDSDFERSLINSIFSNLRSTIESEKDEVIP